MTISKLLTPVALVATLALTVAPAQAQRRGGESSRGSRGVQRGSSSRGAVRSSGPVYRGGGVDVRGGGAVRVAPRYNGSRGFYRGPSYYGPSYYGSSYYGRSYSYRPYYSFRPRVSLGFGLWLGYPVGYPSYYAAPYAYAEPYPLDPYAYENSAPSYAYPSQPYAPPNPSSAYPPQDSYRRGPSIGVQGGNQQASSGGVSFEITPESAQVFVDGRFVATAGTFGPSSQPLDLSAGRHRVEIRAQGYRTMSFEADVVPGQVIPVQGTLQRD